MGGTDLSSRVIICIDYGRLRQACSMVCKSIPSTVMDLLRLIIGGVEDMSTASIGEVYMSTLE